MFKIENNKITIIQGDTGILNLSLDNYKLGEGDVVYFTAIIRSTKEIVINKKIEEFLDGVAVIYFTKEDTINLDLGTYFYDVQVNTKDGRIDTVITPSKFVVMEGISNEY